MSRLALFVNPDVLLDLDGEALRSAARRALDAFAAPQAVIVPASARTLGEVNSVWPFPRGPRIAENGALIELAGDDSDTPQQRLLGPDRLEIQRNLSGLRSQYGWRFRTLREISNETLAKITGLSLFGAAQAGERQASELVIWDDGPQAWIEFHAALRHRGLRGEGSQALVEITGATNKGVAMAEVLAWLRRDDDHWRVGAIGYAPSDLPMLEAADLAVVLRPAKDAPPPRQPAGAVELPLTAAGWEAAGQALRRWWEAG